MTYLENKKIFYSLIDEYAPKTRQFSEDEDAIEKCACLYAPAYQELANEKPIYKLKDLNHNYTGEDKYIEYSLPNYKQIKRITAIDADNKPAVEDYYFLGKKKIFINANSDAKYFIEYTVDPSVITDDTPDEFELEIDLDAQLMLPYLVANDYLKTDPSANYSAFLNEFNRKMQKFDTRKKGITIKITEGEM